jgi:ribosomal protein S3AE
MAQQNKTGKKGFFEVVAPFTSSKISLYAGAKEELVGKTVTLDLTRSLRGKSFEMKVKVGLDVDKLTGEPTSIALAGSYIRRMMRKGSDYVEDSFETTCKDGKVRVKPFMITRNKVSRAVRNELRKESRKFLEGFVTTRTSKEVFSDLTSNKIQRELSMKLKKIYPLALCEIRVFEMIFEKKIEKSIN